MFNKSTFQIWRLTLVSGSKKNYQNTGRVLVGTLDPVDLEFAAMSGSVFGKTFRIFSESTSTDVKENDRLKLGTDEYEVKGVQIFNNAPKHLEVITEKIIAQ